MADLTAGEAAHLDRLRGKARGLTVGTRIRNAEVSITSLETSETSAQAVLHPYDLRLESGAAMPVHVDGTVDGWDQVANKGLCLHVNNSGTPKDMAAMFLMPNDLDSSADVVVHLLGSVSSTNNTPTFTVEAYFDVVGAAIDADTNAGDTSGTFSGSNISEQIVTIAAADVPASPSHLTLIFHPTDGELGTDDFYLSGIWLEYTRKQLTS